jgi:Ni/Fe-hydrogenase subunit HybB-like protein
MKIRITKMILWFLAGLGSTIIALRILHGPGSVTVLTDILPWGLWKGWGVVALVPIGGAGFTVAMLVYIFQMERFKPVVRGAVLLGLICYSSVAIGLSMDIGIWWRIIFPVFHWQFHSVLFEIAWCIMLYLLVLVAEFGHTVLKTLGWRRALGILEKSSIFFVVFGICLSTLHQSSLGTLFLATPFRLHPLWHTDFLPILFFISSMALGCLTISLLTIAVYWLYGGEPPMRAISGLGRFSGYLMVVYLVIKFTEILAAGEGALLMAAGWDTVNFWTEIILSAAIPAVILLRGRYRESKTAMFWVSVCAVIGMSLNRVNVAGLATLSLTESLYFPAWTEWVMTFGILSAAVLFYLFCVERFDLFDGVRREHVSEWITPEQFDHADWKALYFGGQRLGSTRLYSLAFVLAAALSFGAVSEDAVFGVSPEKTPASNPRWVQVAKTTAVDGSGPTFMITAGVNNPSSTNRDEMNSSKNDAGNPRPNGSTATVILLDSNRNGRYVLFDHEAHVSRNDGEESCVLCHHMNKPYSRATGCYECHSDMYLAADVFDHDLHMQKLGGNRHCADCHIDPSLAKIMENTKNCLECHRGMASEGARVKAGSPRINTVAVGYMDAVHTLCITCHKESQESMTDPDENLSRCTRCHQSLPDLEDEVWKSHL